MCDFPLRKSPKIRCAAASALIAASLLSGCSYIQTLDPNDNSRLLALREDRQVHAAQAGPALSTEAMLLRIQELEASGVILRARRAGDGIIVEAFTGIEEVRSVIAAALAADPDAMASVEVIHGTRTPADELPAGILPSDPDGLPLFFEDLEEWGAVMGYGDTYQSERDLAPEALIDLVRQLVLVADPAPQLLDRPNFRLELGSREGGPRGASLTLDRTGRLQAELPNGTRQTFRLLNPAQLTQLTQLFGHVIYEFSQTVQIPAEEPADTGVIELPWGDPAAVISQEVSLLEVASDLREDFILLEMALVGRAGSGELGAAVDAPEEVLQIRTGQRTRPSVDDAWLVSGTEVIDAARAQGLTRQWGLGDDAFAEAVTVLRAKARFSFLQSLTMRGSRLDPAADWRQP